MFIPIIDSVLDCHVSLPGNTPVEGTWSPIGRGLRKSRIMGRHRVDQSGNFSLDKLGNFLSWPSHLSSSQASLPGGAGRRRLAADWWLLAADKPRRVCLTNPKSP